MHLSLPLQLTMRVRWLVGALQSVIYLMNVENADTNQAEIPGLELWVWSLLANVGISLLGSWLSS